MDAAGKDKTRAENTTTIGCPVVKVRNPVASLSNESSMSKVQLCSVVLYSDNRMPLRTDSSAQISPVSMDTVANCRASAGSVTLKGPESGVRKS